MREIKSEYTEAEYKILELSDAIVELDAEIVHLKDIIGSQKWDATEFEKDYILDLVIELRNTIKILEIDNQALRDSRDMFQNRNVELLKTISGLKRKLKA
jgi:hypothetical protein|tara:strand:+ start:414 stop:713 length:300 start_codon:yes stop_codon:yes gene_type:complete